MMLTFLLPLDIFTLETTLTASDVRARLASEIDPRQQPSFNIFKEDVRTKQYEGEISDTEFHISRIIKNRNSFLPEIHGKILALPGKTQIKIKMSPHIFVLTFLLLIPILGLAFGLGILYSMITNQTRIPNQRSSPQTSIMVYMFIGAYLVFTTAYRVEAQRSKRFLNELLLANDVNH